MIEMLLWATPLGLLIDIGGFLLIFLYGHAIFIRGGPGPAPEKGTPGSMYIQHEGPSDESGDGNLIRWAYAGVCAVVTGFALQIVGAIAAICLTV